MLGLFQVSLGFMEVHAHISSPFKGEFRVYRGKSSHYQSIFAENDTDSLIKTSSYACFLYH